MLNDKSSLAERLLCFLTQIFNVKCPKIFHTILASKLKRNQKCHSLFADNVVKLFAPLPHIKRVPGSFQGSGSSYGEFVLLMPVSSPKIPWFHPIGQKHAC